MRSRGRFVAYFVIALALLAVAVDARAQGQQTVGVVVDREPGGWFVDFGLGIGPSINGNINSGAIGTLQGLATAILPHSYGDVYGTGPEFRFGGGYMMNKDSEVRGMFVTQTADADLVRMGDIGPSSLYGQYSDYKSIGLDFSYRHYLAIPQVQGLRAYGEVGIGAAFIDRINCQFAAPQANVIVAGTDFYDASAALTLSLNIGALYKVAKKMDVWGQFGLRRVGGLSQVDQFIGTGLDDINNDTSRLTVPFSVGVRFRFK
jgi:hypothetical protein